MMTRSERSPHSRHLAGLALAGLLLAAPAGAGDVELWVGETSTQSISRAQIVGGSVRIENSDPSVATVTAPRGDNATITITGVKEGKTSIKATGLMVVYHMGTGPRNVRTEEEFTAYIDVVVKKPEEIAKLAILHEKQRMSIRFPKKPERITVLEVLTNSNPKVATAKRNAPGTITVVGKRAGTSVVTMKLKVKPKKGPARTVKGVLHVEVRKLVGKRKENVRIGWNDLFIGRVVIVDEDKPRKREPRPYSYPSPESRRDRPVRVLPPGATGAGAYRNPGASAHQAAAYGSFEVLQQVMPQPRPRHQEPSGEHPDAPAGNESPSDAYAVQPVQQSEAQPVEAVEPGMD